MGIGQRIAARLAQQGMSQSELARRVGLRQSTVNGLINGHAQSSAHLHTIARELNTSVAYLAGETNDPECEFPDQHLTSEEISWVQKLSLLDVEARRAVLNLIDVMGGQRQQLRGGGLLHDKPLDYRPG